VELVLANCCDHCQLLWWNWYWQIYTMKERSNCSGHCQLLWWNWYWQIAAVAVSYFGGTFVGKFTP